MKRIGLHSFTMCRYNSVIWGKMLTFYQWSETEARWTIRKPLVYLFRKVTTRVVKWSVSGQLVVLSGLEWSRPKIQIKEAITHQNR